MKKSKFPNNFFFVSFIPKALRHSFHRRKLFLSAHSPSSIHHSDDCHRKPLLLNVPQVHVSSQTNTAKQSWTTVLFSSCHRPTCLPLQTTSFPTSSLAHFGVSLDSIFPASKYESPSAFIPSLCVTSWCVNAVRNCFLHSLCIAQKGWKHVWATGNHEGLIVIHCTSLLASLASIFGPIFQSFLHLL